MMDWQTVVALVCVSLAASVVGYRVFVSVKGLVSNQADSASGCGSCGGCSSRGKRLSGGSEPEVVLITPKPRSNKL